MPDPKKIIRHLKQQPIQQQQSVKKLVPKKEIVTEDEEEIIIEDSDFEEAIEETVKPTKQRLVPKRVVDVEEESEESEEDIEEERPRKAAKKKSRLALGFAQVPLSGGTNQVKAGNYEAVIRMTLQPYTEGKGQAVRINARLAPPEFREYEPLVDWRTLIAKNGELNPTGFRILGREMAILGYAIPDTDSEDFDEDLDAVFGEIAKDEPGAIIKVYYSRYEGVDYPHFNIQAECKEDVIQELKDEIAY